jgi:replication-associated recombination protein RarA
MDNNRDAIVLGHGKDYQYPHDNEDHFVPQQYLPKEQLGKYFYSPSTEGYELVVKDRLTQWRDAQRRALGISKTEELPELSREIIEKIKQKTR